MVLNDAMLWSEGMSPEAAHWVAVIRQTVPLHEGEDFEIDELLAWCAYDGSRKQFQRYLAMARHLELEAGNFLSPCRNKSGRQVMTYVTNVGNETSDASFMTDVKRARTFRRNNEQRAEWVAEHSRSEMMRGLASHLSTMSKAHSMMDESLDQFLGFMEKFVAGQDDQGQSE